MSKPLTGAEVVAWMEEVTPHRGYKAAAVHFGVHRDRVRYLAKTFRDKRAGVHTGGDEGEETGTPRAKSPARRTNAGNGGAAGVGEGGDLPRELPELPPRAPARTRARAPEAPPSSPLGASAGGQQAAVPATELAPYDDPRLSEPQQRAMPYILDGRRIGDVAKYAEVARTQIREWLEEPTFAGVLATLRAERRRLLLEQLDAAGSDAIIAIRAALRGEQLPNGQRPDKVTIQAAIPILDRLIPKTERFEHVGKPREIRVSGLKDLDREQLEALMAGTDDEEEDELTAARRGKG